MAPCQSLAMQRAISLIQRICDMTAPRNYLANTREYLVHTGIVAAVANHDTPALYRWLVEIISYQGIADRIARDYLDRHGRVRWADIDNGLKRPDPCPKLASYWTFHGCGYRKSACSCAVLPRLPCCLLPTLPMRNGRLAQSAVALHLFLRDLCGGDFISWIDDTLCQSQFIEPNAAPIIDALRHIHGVSDKVLSLALVVLLLGGRPGDSRWQAAGAELVVIDTLVHNWLHRSGILNDLDAWHRYGAKCYGPNGCADIVRRAALLIDARRYSSDNPPAFPRLIQSARPTPSTFAMAIALMTGSHAQELAVRSCVTAAVWRCGISDQTVSEGPNFLFSHARRRQDAGKSRSSARGSFPTNAFNAISFQ
jgi:hypothetical protein